VVGRHRDEHRVREQVLAGDPVDERMNPGIEPDREIDLAGPQQRSRILGLHHDQ
jgi:hypothetical protein